MAVHPYLNTHNHTKTHTAFGNSKFVYALFCNSSQQQLQQKNQSEAYVKEHTHTQGNKGQENGSIKWEKRNILLQ